MTLLNFKQQHALSVSAETVMHLATGDMAFIARAA
jgi:hypothetical protein